MNKRNINNTFVVIDPKNAATEVTASPTLYQELDQNFNNFKNHSLVSSYEFSSSWDSWEVHPMGDEIVLLLSGKVTFVLELNEEKTYIELSKLGEHLIIPKGVWHTAQTDIPSQVLFITPGEKTEHKKSLK